MDNQQVKGYLQQAINLAKAGRREEAAHILRAILQRRQDVRVAWRWLAATTDNQQEALTILRLLLRRDPNDEWARQRYNQLIRQIEMQQAQAISPIPQNTVQTIAVQAPQPVAKGSPYGDFKLTPLWLSAGGLILVLVIMAATTLIQLGTDIRKSTEGLNLTSLVVEAREDQEQEPSEQESVAPSANVRVSVSTDYYSIWGDSVSDIQDGIYNSGPEIVRGEHSIAITTYDIALDGFQMYQYKNTCELTDGTINLNVVYTYPEWIPIDSPSQRLYQQWDEFIAHIIDHEEYHGAIALDCANEIADALSTIGDFDTCTDLDDEISDKITKIYTDCQARQSEFDAREGRTSFPLP